MGRRILTDAGYEVITVNNGSAALRRCGTVPELIVSDVYMPGTAAGGVPTPQRDARTARIPVY